MAWKVKLKTMNMVGNGSIDCECEYYDEPTGRAFTKSYNLQMQTFPSIEAIQFYMAKEVEDLDAFDAVMSQFGEFVGKDII